VKITEELCQSEVPVAKIPYIGKYDDEFVLITERDGWTCHVLMLTGEQAGCRSTATKVDVRKYYIPCYTGVHFANEWE